MALGSLPGAPGPPGARVNKPKNPYFLQGPTERPSTAFETLKVASFSSADENCAIYRVSNAVLGLIASSVCGSAVPLKAQTMDQKCSGNVQKGLKMLKKGPAPLEPNLGFCFFGQPTALL